MAQHPNALSPTIYAGLGEASSSQPVPVLKTSKSTQLLRRITGKLKLPPIPQASASRPEALSAALPLISEGKSRGAAPSLPNDIVSRERRMAALRERGLLPAKDLSELEREFDKRSPEILPPQEYPQDGETSAAQKIRLEWEARHKASDDDKESETRIPASSTRAGNCPSNSHQSQQLPRTTLPSARTDNLESSYPGGKKIPAEKSLPDIPISERSTDVKLQPASQPARSRPPPILITQTSPHLNIVKVSNQQSSVAMVSSPKHRTATVQTALPALSPTRTSSTFSSVETPPDEGGDNGAVLKPLSAGSNSFATNNTNTLRVPRNTTTPDRSVELGGFEAYAQQRLQREGQRILGRSRSGYEKSSSRDAPYRSSGDFTTSTSLPGYLGVAPLRKFTSLRRKISKITLNRTINDDNHNTYPISSPGNDEARLVRRPTFSPESLQTRATILKDVKGIEDAESRRLSELAFLDY